MKAPITSRKHYVQHTEFSTASTTVTNNEVVVATAIQDVNTPNEVQEGSVIKAVFFELWLMSSGAGISSFVVIIQKTPLGLGNPGFSNMTTLDSWANKKNILYTTQGLIPENDGNPIPVLRQWIKIPKGKQRFGLGDRLVLSVAGLGTDTVLGCGFETYKEYS